MKRTLGYRPDYVDSMKPLSILLKYSLSEMQTKFEELERKVNAYKQFYSDLIYFKETIGIDIKIVAGGKIDDCECYQYSVRYNLNKISQMHNEIKSVVSLNMPEEQNDQIEYNKRINFLESIHTRLLRSFIKKHEDEIDFNFVQNLNKQIKDKSEDSDIESINKHIVPIINFLKNDTKKSNKLIEWFENQEISFEVIYF